MSPDGLGGPDVPVVPEGELPAREQAALRVRGQARPRAALSHYVGLATRVVAFTIDAAIINLVAAIVAGGTALALSIFSLQGTPLVNSISSAVPWLAVALFLVWSVVYFVVFWEGTGQTPGDRIMGIAVVRESEERSLGPLKALMRFGAMILAAIPLFAGFLPILTDERCRGLHDRIAGTVVVRPERPVRRKRSGGPDAP